MKPSFEDCCPSVSVIVPCFNASQLLPELLTSFENQNFDRERFEVICVDNGSSDETRKVLEEHAKTLSIDLKCAEESVRIGSYAARNKGIECAKGDVLFFTDADCYADPDWLKNGVAALIAAGGESVCGGAVQLTVASPERPSAVEMFEMILGFSQQRNTEESGYSVTANLICWRESMTKIGHFNSDLLSKGDFEWCSRARRRGYVIRYAGTAKIYHPARRSLASIITKARRVTGGQIDLRKLRVMGPSREQSSRTFGQQLKLVFSDQRFPKSRQKIAVLCVAGVVYFTKTLEKLRLFLGGRSERK